MQPTIIHVNTAMDVFGPEKTTINECLALMSEGINCQIINLDGDPNIPFNDKISKTNIDYTQISCHSGIDFKAISALRDIIQQHSNVLVHSHGYKADIHALFAAKLCKVPIVTTVHGWTTENFKVKMYEMFQRISWRFFDRIFCVSKSYYMVALDHSIPSAKLFLLYNGIKITPSIKDVSEVDDNPLREQLDIPDDILLVGIIGRLSIEKGHDLFIDIANGVSKEFNKVKFVIVGDGPERTSLEACVAQKGLEDVVIFAGHQNNMPMIYKSLDIVLMCSHREGLPNVLLESMFNEVPVVTVTVGGIPEVLDNNQGGVLIEGRNAADFSKEVLNLLRNEDERIAMGKLGKKRVCDAFSFEKRMNEVKAHYTELVSKREA